jgi:hypothetical protein
MNIITPMFIPMPIIGYSGNISLDTSKLHAIGIFSLSFAVYLLWLGFSIWVSDRYFDLSPSPVFGLALVLPLTIIGLILI